MHPGRETSMHYFSCSGGTGRDLTKSASGHITSNLCSCIHWDTQVTYCISVHPGRETSTHYFSCSVGTGMDLTKSASGHVIPNLCFLHPMGSAGNVVHSDASGA
jgi:hypothetical protein